MDFLSQTGTTKFQKTRSTREAAHAVFWRQRHTNLAMLKIIKQHSMDTDNFQVKF